MTVTLAVTVKTFSLENVAIMKSHSPNIYVEMSRNAYMKWDEIKKSNHPILDSSDVFCVQGD